MERHDFEHLDGVLGTLRATRAPSLVAVLLLFALSSLACMRPDETPRVDAGVLDLSDWSFEAQGNVPLEGEWEICWGAFANPGSQDCPSGPGGLWETFPVPRLWSDSGVSSPMAGGKGIASYRATLALPPGSGDLTLRVGSPFTAYLLWIDGLPRGGVGRAGTSAETTTAKLENRDYPLPAGVSRVEILVHLSNFEFRGGGLRRTWYVGRSDQIPARNGNELVLYAAFVTMSVVVGLIFLAQFAFRPSEKARGWFGLFALLVGLRIVPGSASDLYQLLGGWASFGQLIRMEYVNTAVLIFAGAGYLLVRVPGVMPPRLTQVLQLAALALIPIHVFAPLSMVLATIPVILALPPLLVGLSVVSYGRAYRRGVPGAGTTLAAGLAFGVGILHDVFRIQTGWGAPIELFPYFVVAWLASEASTMLQSFARSFATVERLSDELQESNFELQETEEAVVRFVPFDLLRTLGKKSIRDVRAGDYAQAEMSVMRCDLHVAGQRSPEDDFRILNRLIARVEPVIRSKSGFVSQQLGHGIVALFRGGAADAVAAAVQIQEAVRDFNRDGHLGAAPKEKARVGIGIATGRLLLGTVGDEKNLSSVVLGSVADESRRIQAMTRSLGAEVLISELTRDRLSAQSNHSIREVASVEVPGHAAGSPVFEVRSLER